LIEGDAPAANAVQPPAVSIGCLLARREVWGCILARALTDPVSFFFIFWIPKFLQQERGFDLAAIGKYSWIPYVALALGNLAGGWVPGRLMGRGWSHNRARKTVMTVATVSIPLCCLLVTRVPSAAVALGLVTVAMFFHAAWANITLPAEVFPAHVVGSVTGFGGCIGGLCGVLSQQVIGWTVQNGSFAPVFAGVALMYPLAFVAVCMLIGELGRERQFAPPARWPR
jgi:ACS family hexuronate transporter-like MFS transporter